MQEREVMNLGVKYMLFASLCFALMGAFAKLLMDSLPSIEVVFFRNFFGLIALIFMIKMSLRKSVGGKFWLLAFRGVIGSLALVLIFYNIAHITLANAITFSLTAPIFIVIFARVFLNERVNAKVWFGVFLGFVGVVFIMQPNEVHYLRNDLLGVLSGALSALAYVSVKELNRYYQTNVIVMSFMLSGTLIAGGLMVVASFYTNEHFDFLLSEFVMPSGISWLWILLMGIFSLVAQTYMTKAYYYSKAGIIGAISYSNILFSLILGVMLGDMFPNVLGLFGIMMVIFSGILVAKEKG